MLNEGAPRARIPDLDVTLLKQAESSADDDPQVAAIKKEAVAAIGAGDYVRAEGLLRRAFDAARLRCIRTAPGWFDSAITVRRRRAALAMTVATNSVPVFWLVIIRCMSATHT